MEGRKISFVVLAMAGLLTACGSRVWGDDSEISTALAFGEAEECTQNAKTREDTIVKISDCLSEQVPEIDDWAAYVDLKTPIRSRSFARMIQTCKQPERMSCVVSSNGG